MSVTISLPPPPALARTLQVRSFGPKPNNVALVWPTKDPQDVLDYGLDFTPSLLPGEVIEVAVLLALPPEIEASCSYLAAPAGGSDPALVGFWVSGGTLGKTYAVSWMVQTSGNRTLHLSAALPLASHATPGIAPLGALASNPAASPPRFVLEVLAPFGAYRQGNLIVDPAAIAALQIDPTWPERLAEIAVSDVAVAGAGGGSVALPSGLVVVTDVQEVGGTLFVSRSDGTSQAYVLATGGSAATAAPVRGSYSASGALAVTDDISLVASTAAVTMTLGAGLVDGHAQTIKQMGLGPVTVLAVIDGQPQAVLLNAPGPLGDSLTLSWFAAHATYLGV